MNNDSTDFYTMTWKILIILTELDSLRKDEECKLDYRLHNYYNMSEIDILYWHYTFVETLNN